MVLYTMVFLGKKGFSSVPSLRSLFSFRIVTAILAFQVLVVYLRHSHFLTYTDVGDSQGKEMHRHFTAARKLDAFIGVKCLQSLANFRN